MKPKLIVIHGVPAAGKTTLKKRLSDDFGLPAISKDDIKENMYDVLGTSDLAWKELLGRASIRMLYIAADEVLASGKSLIIENAFFVEYAPKDLRGIVAAHDADVIEIYCRLPIALAKQRFIARQATGERHQGHRDDLHAEYIEDQKFWARYQPLKIGEYIEVNTENFDEDEYAKLRQRIKEFLERTE